MAHDLPPGSRVVNYIRVSTQEQKKGWSPKDQERSLEQTANTKGWKVVAVCQDLGASGSVLEREGMDQAKDLAEAGDIDAVVDLYRSRLARDNVLVAFLRKWFGDRGVKLVALNTQSDESPSGFLQDNIQGIFDQYESLIIMERMKSGRLAKAREGHVVGGHTPPYGYTFDESRRTFLPNPPTQHVVKRIFKMVAVEGHALHAVKKVLDSEGIPTPGSASPAIGGDCKYWQKTFIKRLIQSDIYYPHTQEELDALVKEGVLSAKTRETWRDSDAVGIWWYNATKYRPKDERTPYTKPDGSKGYRTRYKKTERSRREWVAVPVQDLGLPREWVVAARERVRDNTKPALKRDGRLWEISGGLTRCGTCGRNVYINSIKRKNSTYRYYRCPTVRDNGAASCGGGSWGADHVESLVWEFVKALLSEPLIVLSAVDAAIRREEEASRGDISEDYEFWHSHLEAATEKRDRYVEMYAEGVIGRGERDRKLADIDSQIRDAQKALARVEDKKDKAESLKRDRETLRRSYEARGLRSLDRLTPVQRRRLYEILRIQVELVKDQELKGKVRSGKDAIVKIRGVLVEAVWGAEGCTFREATEIASMYNFTNRMSLACGMIPNEEYHALAR